MSPRKPPDGPTPDRVRDISEVVYRERLGAADTASMIAEHGEEGLRLRAGAYDTLTRAYLRAIGRGA